jgi:hypothetical protein
MENTQPKVNLFNLEQAIESRIAKAIEALNNPLFSDPGLEMIFDLLTLVKGRVARGATIYEISQTLKQSKAGKGFHMASMYDIFFVTEDVLKISWEYGKIPTGQRVTCWEHAIPWNFTISRIEELLEKDSALENDADLIRILIEGSVKCFVSKDEDDRLNGAGIRDRVPQGISKSPVFSRYQLVEIKPLPLKSHDFNKINMKELLDGLRKKSKASSFSEYKNEIIS